MRSVKKLDVESPLADSRQRPSIAIPSPYLLNYNYRFSDLEKKTASLGNKISFQAFGTLGNDEFWQNIRSLSLIRCSL